MSSERLDFRLNACAHCLKCFTCPLRYGSDCLCPASTPRTSNSVYRHDRQSHQASGKKQEWLANFAFHARLQHSMHQRVFYSCGSCRTTLYNALKGRDIFDLKLWLIYLLTYLPFVVREPHKNMKNTALFNNPSSAIVTGTAAVVVMDKENIAPDLSAGNESSRSRS